MIVVDPEPGSELDSEPASDAVPLRDAVSVLKTEVRVAMPGLAVL